jgi:hypothetical protein
MMEWVSVPVGILLLVGGFGILSWAAKSLLVREKARWKAPFTEKMIRPAGESLRIRIEELRSELMEHLAVFAAYLMLPGFLVLMNHALQPPLQWILTTVFSAGAVALAIRCWGLASRAERALPFAREIFCECKTRGGSESRFVTDEQRSRWEKDPRSFHRSSPASKLQQILHLVER